MCATTASQTHEAGGHEDPVTAIKAFISAGGPSDDLLPLVYDDLRRLARARLRGQPSGQLMQPTALVHEAFIRLVDGHCPSWENCGHFFAAAARAMRDVIIDRARRRMALKRGGDRRRVDLTDAPAVCAPPAADLIALDEALLRLERVDPRKSQIVNLRYFAGLTTEETAAALGVSVGTVGREWRYIRAWLARELRGTEPQTTFGEGAFE